MQAFDAAGVVLVCFQLPNGFAEIAEIGPLFSIT